MLQTKSVDKRGPRKLMSTPAEQPATESSNAPKQSGTSALRNVILASTVISATIFFVLYDADNEPVVPENSTDAVTQHHASPGAQTSDRSTQTALAFPEETLDERYTRLLTGYWETERDGKRILTVNEDGTAVMDVTIDDTISRLTFGEKLKFDIVWEIKDGQLNFETTGGEPETMVNLVVSIYGSEQSQEILELTEERLLLKDTEEGEPDHDYKRLAEPPTDTIEKNTKTPATDSAVSEDKQAAGTGDDDSAQASP